MRLKAVHELTYAGQQLRPGDLFDALPDDGQDLVQRDLARPFNLEDPSTRRVDVIMQDLNPQGPHDPESHLTPSYMEIASAGGSFQFAVESDGARIEWVARSQNDWIQLIDPAPPVVGDGTVSFSAPNNHTGPARTGTILISGLDLLFTVKQSAGNEVMPA